MSVLPALETHEPNDLVDIVDDALDYHGRFLRARFLKEVRQGGLPELLLLDRRRSLLRRDDVTRQVEKFFEKLDAQKQSLLVTLPQSFETLAEFLKARIASPLA